MTRNFSKKFLLIFVLLGLVVLPGLRCKLFPEKEKQRIKPIVLNWWRTGDEPGAVAEIINQFQKQYSHVKINYQQFRPEEYEQALLEAWAEDKGPDIFSIPNTWTGKYQTKILPMPEKFSIGRQIVSGQFKKDYKIIVEEKRAYAERDLKNIFVDAVAGDVYRDNKVWGLPVALDTLALYYNRKLLNQAKIADPPATWDEFVSDVKKLNIVDQGGNIVQSAVAMGMASNVNNAADILTVLMMQNGTKMASGGAATFNMPSAEEPGYFPGEEALRFYTDFANPAKEVYSWNKNLPSAFDAFIQSKAAFYFGYASDIIKVRNAAPNLDFDLVKMPQIGTAMQEANIASYAVETVAKRTKYANEAWAFLKFATEDQNVKSYLSRAKKPTAHRSLIKDQLEDFDLAPFANQVLVAQSWYRGRDWPSAEKQMKEMIDMVASGTETVKQAINFYIQRVNQTY